MSDKPDSVRLAEWEQRVRSVLDEMEEAVGDFKPNVYPPAYLMLTRLAWSEMFDEQARLRRYEEEGVGV